MFWIFKIFPDWLWPVLMVLAIIAFFISHLVPLKQYQLPIKIVAGITIAVTIFICGLQYADQKWQAAARELQAKVDLMAAQSQQVNEVIKEKLVTKIQVIKQRGETIIEYVDREVIKHDVACVIPPEFVRAHNSASEAPK
jgi:Glu-tRNA(Gln) amidotransferase subunit E-like FAD-binding protein